MTLRELSDLTARTLVRWLPPFLLVLVIALVVTTPLFFDRPATEALYRDPNATAGQPFYYGLFSNMTAVAWMAAAGIAFFALRIQKARGEAVSSHIAFIFLISAIFGVDDLFMVHDGYAPAIGIGEKTTYTIYAAIALLWLAREYRAIFAGPFAIAFLAGALIASTILIDLLAPYLEAQIERPGGVPLRIILEDSIKLAGAVTWLCYVTLVCQEAVTGKRAVNWLRF